jgi:hypothetical protein
LPPRLASYDELGCGREALGEPLARTGAISSGPALRANEVAIKSAPTTSSVASA